MKIIIVASLLILSACAQTTDYGGCSVVSIPTGAEIHCKDGTKTVVLNGVDGVAGYDGAAGTQVAIVPLCLGTTTYPSTFIEIAFLINGELYATYSANGGFSTMLPPGNYLSNAIGSSCNFTVNTDRTISH